MELRDKDVSIAQLGTDIGSYLRAPGASKRTFREKVICSLAGLVPISEGIDLLLRECLASGYAGRLDDGVDVLSDRRIPLRAYLNAAMLHLEDRPSDEQYILIRAESRRPEPIDVWRLAAHSDASVREAVVDALDDMGTPRARAFLKQIAENDPSPRLRKYAWECLADLEEA